MNEHVRPAATLIKKPGIYYVVPSADYFADPCPIPSLTQSIAKVLLEKSPEHAFCLHPRLGRPRTDEDEIERYDSARAIGNAAHSLLIGRGKDIAVGDFSTWQSATAKEFRAIIERCGQVAILAKHMKRAEAMALIARNRIADSERPDAFHNGMGEVVIAWQENGIWFRSMIDWLHDDQRTVDDYKTTGMSAAPYAIPKMMADAGWAVQAAFQERGLDVLDPNGAGRRKFRFLVQENEHPHAMTVAELPEATLHIGRRQLNVAIAIWSDCMRTGRWPGYSGAVVRPEYPSWSETRWLDREVGEFAELINRDTRKLVDLSGAY